MREDSKVQPEFGEVLMMKKCANENCGKVYQPRTHNMKYCSAECCKEVTNKRIMSAYYADKARKSGKQRVCKTCKVNQLSRYNTSTTCQMCESKQKSKQRSRLLEMVRAA
jgi:hypothetical protein